MAVSSSSSSSDQSTAAEPQFIGATVSSLCSLGVRPQLITGVLRDVLIRHFYSSDTIEEYDLRHLLWTANDRTKILIESIHRWKPGTVERRPAILIKFNGIQNHRVGVGDRNLGPSANMYGHATYSTFWYGSHTVFCIAAEGAQAQLLGTEVQRELTQFGPQILATLDLKKFQVVDVRGLNEIEEAREAFAVPINIGYAYEEKWILREQAMPLRRISLSLLTEG